MAKKVTGNELVKYQNTLNDVLFNKFRRRDFNIYFALVSRMRDKGTDTVSIPFTRLEDLSGLHYNHHQKAFSHDLHVLSYKMTSVRIIRKSKHKFENFDLFPYFAIDDKKKIVTVQVNQRLVGIVNKLYSNFTRFSLRVFDSIKSSYAKTGYRYVKQFRTSGHVRFPIKKFRRLFCIPKSYSNGTITKRCIKPIEIELTPLVRGLHVITLRGSKGRITGYEFTFSPEAPNQDYWSKGHFRDIQIMKENVKNNDFISPKLKEKAMQNIHRMEHKHTHKILSAPKKNAPHEPIEAFNRTLKHASLANLEYLYDIRNTKLTNFSSYQIRKLRRTISKKKSYLKHKSSKS